MSRPEADSDRGAEDLLGLDRRVVPYWAVITFLQAAAFLIALQVTERFIGQWLPVDLLSWAVIGFGVGLVLVYPSLRYRSWRVQLQQDALNVRRGIWLQTTSIVPYHRIQHVDTRRDLLERWLGIARVVVFTAGIRGAELVIPGVESNQAAALRDHLAELGGAGEGV